MFGFIKGQSKIINKRSDKLIGLFTSSLHAINLGALRFIYLDRNKVHALAISHNEYNNEIVSTEDSIREIQ